MIKAAVINNGIVGLNLYFQSNDKVQYDYLEVGENLVEDFSAYDLLVVPNGTDQVAMLRMKNAVQSFLNQGKTLFCFDGWFTDWLPGNQWLMDNTKKTIDIRYHIKEDKYDLFANVDVNSFIYSNGISGWWACGYIEPATEAEVVLADTWERAIMILDEKSTPGKIFATASGPLGDSSYATTDDEASLSDLAKFYHNLLDKLIVSG